MDEDGALTRLYYYMENEMKEPESWMPKEVKDAYVYSRWTAEEIYERLIMESYILPEAVSFVQHRTTSQVLGDFIAMVDEHARTSRTEQGRYIFSIVGDEARRIAAYIC